MCSIESLWVPLWPVPGTFFSPRETDSEAGGTRVRKRLNIVYRAFIQIQTPTTAPLMADEISRITRDRFSRGSWESCCRTTRWGLRSKHLSEAFSQGSGLQALLTRVSNDLLMAPVAGSASDLSAAFDAIKHHTIGLRYCSWLGLVWPLWRDWMRFCQRSES